MFNWLTRLRRERRWGKQRHEVLANGTRKISSGVLTPGERQRMFRNRPKGK